MDSTPSIGELALYGGAIRAGYRLSNDSEDLLDDPRFWRKMRQSGRALNFFSFTAMRGTKISLEESTKQRGVFATCRKPKSSPSIPSSTTSLNLTSISQPRLFRAGNSRGQG
jgi:hypothetical protein